MLSNMRDCEVALRSQLVEDLGLKASERIKPTTSKSNEHNDDYECDVCHSILYISMVTKTAILLLLYIQLNIFICFKTMNIFN